MSAASPFFAHLQVRSDYSLGCGALDPYRIAALAAQHNMRSVALCDRYTFAGIPAFQRGCKAAGIHPIIGVEVDLVNRRGVQAPALLLAQDDTGLNHMMELAAASGGSPIRTRELKNRAGFVVVTTGVSSLTPTPQERDLAGDLLASIAKAVGKERLYAQMVFRGLQGEAADRMRLQRQASDLGVRCLATGDVRYAEESEAGHYQTYDSLSVGGVQHFTATEAMVQHAAEPWVSAVGDLAATCNARLDVSLDSYRDEGADRILTSRVLDALRRRHQAAPEGPAAESPAELDRVAEELEAVCKSGCASAILALAVVSDSAPQEGILVGPGRGGMAGLYINYLLGITRIDPIKHGLGFEPLLSTADRGAALQVDVAPDRRQQVQNRLVAAHPAGALRLASYIRFNAASALRHIERTFSQTLNGHYAGSLLATVNEQRSSLRESQWRAYKPSQIMELADVDVSGGRTQEVLAYADWLTGRVMRVGEHASTLLILPDGANLPCRLNAHGQRVCQVPVEELGNITSISVLGLRTLEIIEKVAPKFQADGDDTGRIWMKDVDPSDHYRAWEMLSSGALVGLPGLESSPLAGSVSGRTMAEGGAPGNVEELSCFLALLQPRGLDAYKEYMRRGREEGPYDSDHLPEPARSILAATRGMILWREQVIALGRAYGGMTAEEANSWSLALPRELQSDTRRYGDQFYSHASALIGAPPARAILNLIQEAGARLRVRAHYIAYASMMATALRLKTEYPAAYLAGAYNAYPGLDHGRIDYEARQIGVLVLDSDVNHSREEAYAPSHREVRKGLRDVRGLSHRQAAAIVREREKGGAYSIFEDLVRRAQLDKRGIETVRDRAWRGPSGQRLT